MAIVIVKGETATIRVEVINKKTGRPYDFTGLEGATGQFATATDGVPHNVTGTLVECNILQFPAATGDTAMLNVAEDQDFWYRWKQNGQLFIERVEGQLTVIESPYA